MFGRGLGLCKSKFDKVIVARCFLTVLTRGVAGGGMAAAIPVFWNFCCEAPPSGQFVFTGCHTNILLPATPLP